MARPGMHTDSSVTAALMIVTNLLSAFSAIFLIQLYKGMPARAKKTVFAWQMANLAVADLMGCLFNIPNALIEFSTLIDLPSSDMGMPWCLGIAAPLYVFMLVSVLVETQVAVGLFLVHFRCIFFMSWVLDQKLILTWLLGIGIGIWNAVGIYFNDASGTCAQSTRVPVLSVVLAVCFSISALAYVSTLFSVCMGEIPASTARKLKLQALFYPLNFFATYLLLWLNTLPISLYSSPSYLHGAALTLQSCNGLLNALTYALVFYGYRKLMRVRSRGVSEETIDEDDDDPLGFASFHVKFGGVEVRSFGEDIAEVNASAQSTLDETAPPSNSMQ